MALSLLQSFHGEYRADSKGKLKFRKYHQQTCIGNWPNKAIYQEHQRPISDLHQLNRKQWPGFLQIPGDLQVFKIHLRVYQDIDPKFMKKIKEISQNLN